MNTEKIKERHEYMNRLVQRFHADGMTEGGIATGDIYIVCNGGE